MKSCIPPGTEYLHTRQRYRNFCTSAHQIFLYTTAECHLPKHGDIFLYVVPGETFFIYSYCPYKHTLLFGGCVAVFISNTTGTRCWILLDRDLEELNCRAILRSKSKEKIVPFSPNRNRTHVHITSDSTQSNGRTHACDRPCRNLDCPYFTYSLIVLYRYMSVPFEADWRPLKVGEYIPEAGTKK